MKSFFQKLKREKKSIIDSIPYHSIFWKISPTVVLLLGLLFWVRTPVNGENEQLAKKAWNNFEYDVAPIVEEIKDNEAEPLSPQEDAETKSVSQQLVGHWILEDTIQREIKLRSDGTATMLVKLDYLSALLYGKEITFNLNWDLEEGILSHHIIGGVPEKNVRLITNAFGDTASYRILELDNDQLLLQGPLNSKKIEHWKAVK